MQTDEQSLAWVFSFRAMESESWGVICVLLTRYWDLGNTYNIYL